MHKPAGLVSGHEFTRADNASKSVGALSATAQAMSGKRAVGAAVVRPALQRGEEIAQ